MVVPTQTIYLWFCKGPSAYFVPYLWQCAVCKIFGLKVIVRGEAVSKEQTVYCSNHISYLDIPVIGSVLKASFVAKSEVEHWPVFGFLSKLQQTIFISRKRGDAAKESEKIKNSLQEGKNIILFPEGTSTDGRDVNAMKAAMLVPVMGIENAYIQPFTVRIKTVNKQSLDGSESDQDVRDLYAWHGDMELAPHLWTLAKTKGAEIELIFHTPFAANKYSDRKELIKYCEEKIRNALV